MNNKRKIVFHIDVDSPARLLDFYNSDGSKYELGDLESFYETSFERIFAFFDKLGIKASFFIVGSELERSEILKDLVKKAHSLGHEIENHTYSHPFGLAEMEVEEIRRETTKCSELIHSITGRKPVGFRAPGYSINDKVLNILKDEGFKYDSSCFWSVMIPALKYGKRLLLKGNIKNEGFGYVDSKLPHEPFDILPGLKELPLPRTKVTGLPFYNNFNLWAPKPYSAIVSKTIKRDILVYLFHAVEFMDMGDGLPKEIEDHPNIKLALKLKLERSEKIVKTLLKRYEPARSGELII